jgi:hypothetical protein
MSSFYQCCGAGDGAGGAATFCWSRVYKFSKNVTKTQNFSYKSLKLTLKITIWLLFTLENLLMIIYVFKKHEIFLKPMKIVESFLIICGKLSELEPDPEFLTSWSRSRSWSGTKMDRLRNTGFYRVEEAP